VSQRRRELGIRVALGARPSELATLVQREGLWLAGIGVGLGLLGARAATSLLAGMLFGVQPGDLATLAAVAVLLIVVTAAAAWLPARRAAHMDPLESLRP
jgi:ABC-type antimicrobial peptide transport system permease subunit